MEDLYRPVLFSGGRRDIYVNGTCLAEPFKSIPNNQCSILRSFPASIAWRIAFPDNWKISIHRRPQKAQHIVDLICSVKVHNIVYLAGKNGVILAGNVLTGYPASPSGNIVHRYTGTPQSSYQQR